MAKKKLKSGSGETGHIRKCGCVSYMGGTRGAAYQNRRYGTGRRVHVKTDHGWRCTVCGSDNR